MTELLHQLQRAFTGRFVYDDTRKGIVVVAAHAIGTGSNPADAVRMAEKAFERLIAERLDLLGGTT